MVNKKIYKIVDILHFKTCEEFVKYELFSK